MHSCKMFEQHFITFFQFNKQALVQSSCKLSAKSEWWQRLNENMEANHKATQVSEQIF